MMSIVIVSIITLKMMITIIIVIIVVTGDWDLEPAVLYNTVTILLYYYTLHSCTL